MVYIIDDKAKYVPANNGNIIMKKKSPINIIWEENITKRTTVTKKRIKTGAVSGSVNDTLETKNAGEVEFLQEFNILFILCKFIGLYPHEWQTFKQRKQLKKSNMGIVFVIMALIIITALYTLLVINLTDQENENQSTLTYIISMFLTYAVLCMMYTDQLNAIYNQGRINSLYERLRIVDAQLSREHIYFNNASISKCIMYLILITVVLELVSFITSAIFLYDEWEWTNLLWIIGILPTLYNSLDKIWFAATLLALKVRFSSINAAIDKLTLMNKSAKRRHVGRPYDDISDRNINVMDKNIEWEFFRKEFNMQGAAMKRNRISPKWTANANMSIKLIETTKSKNFSNIPLENLSFNEVEHKLNILCRQHDELCEIGKYLNDLWSYPIIMLMAYGFLMFTSQLYFHYCATQNQPIPDIFLTANSIFITLILLSYTGGKCAYLVYLSWITSLECKRTGLCLHKCSVATDTNSFYNIANHLSLKLLNHSVDFSACGFFALNMETLVGVVSGITSYLIILIQFNLAAQQAKHYYLDSIGATTTATTASADNDSNLLTFLQNESTTFMPLTTIHIDVN